MKRYVQHMSKQGRVFEIYDETRPVKDAYVVWSDETHTQTLHIPKSDYNEFSWKPVTDLIIKSDDLLSLYHNDIRVSEIHAVGYRYELVKVHQISLDPALTFDDECWLVRIEKRSE